MKYSWNVKILLNIAIKLVSNHSEVEMNKKVAKIVKNLSVKNTAPPIYSKTF